MKLAILIPSVLLVACVAKNPNPGEKITDSLWQRGKFYEAVDNAWPAAQRGEPWAQLRLGFYYDTGAGVKVDPLEAIKWYKLAARQFEEGRWAEGQTIAAMGKEGYHGQKNDALIAQYRLANLYSQGRGIEKNLALSWLLINNVIEKSNGNSVYFCCDWSKERKFQPAKFTDLKTKIESQLNPLQLKKLNRLAQSWQLKYDL